MPPALYQHVHTEPARASTEAFTRTGLLAGLAALGSLALTAHTYQLTTQGQLTNRYTKTIAQLSNDKRDIRPGSIYPPRAYRRRPQPGPPHRRRGATNLRLQTPPPPPQPMRTRPAIRMRQDRP